MPMPDKMGVAFSGTQKADILTALNSSLAILNIIKVVQLTSEERQAAQSASATRLPYVENGIYNLAPNFPPLQPGYMPLADATKDADMNSDLQEILVVVNEIRDRFTDFSLACQHFGYFGRSGLIWVVVHSCHDFLCSIYPAA